MFTKLLYPLLALLMLPSCGLHSPLVANESGVRIVDLKVSGLPTGWVDNETILLSVDSGETFLRKDGSRSAVIRLVGFNYQTKEQRIYGRTDAGLCFFNGYVSYFYQDEQTGELIAAHGLLGQEKRQIFKSGSIDFDRGPRGSCRPWNERPAIPDWIGSKAGVWHLSPGLGFVDCNVAAATVDTRRVKARFHSLNDHLGVELPFSCYQIQTSLRYYSFRNAYFGLEFDVRSPWPVGRDRFVFWLHPDGNVEQVLLRYSDAIRDEVIPTARGLMAFSQPYDRAADYWVYFITADATKPVLRGYATGVTSPDGCKVAVLHDPERRARVEGRKTAADPSVKVLEVCN